MGRLRRVSSSPQVCWQPIGRRVTLVTDDQIGWKKGCWQPLLILHPSPDWGKSFEKNTPYLFWKKKDTQLKIKVRRNWFIKSLVTAWKRLFLAFWRGWEHKVNISGVEKKPWIAKKTARKNISSNLKKWVEHEQSVARKYSHTSKESSADRCLWTINNETKASEL